MRLASYLSIFKNGSVSFRVRARLSLKSRISTCSLLSNRSQRTVWPLPYQCDVLRLRCGVGLHNHGPNAVEKAASVSNTTFFSRFEIFGGRSGTTQRIYKHGQHRGARADGSFGYANPTPKNPDLNKVYTEAQVRAVPPCQGLSVLSVQKHMLGAYICHFVRRSLLQSSLAAMGLYQRLHMATHRS
eukprot:SAG31_NODE_6771_length_1894_cov_1.070195_1_plen_186_part_00